QQRAGTDGRIEHRRRLFRATNCRPGDVPRDEPGREEAALLLGGPWVPRALWGSAAVEDPVATLGRLDGPARQMGQVAVPDRGEGVPCARQVWGPLRPGHRLGASQVPNPKA